MKAQRGERRADAELIRRVEGGHAEPSPATAPQGHLPGQALLRIRLHIDSGVDTFVVDGARRVAEGLLSAAGIATTWEASDQTRDVAPSSTIAEVITILRLDALRPSRGRSCGYAARVDDHSGGSIVVSVSCLAEFVRELSRSEYGRHPWLARPRHDDVVGVVIAHEVAHVLGVGHASAGIMRHTLHGEDLVALRAGTLAFQPKDVTRLRVGLAAASARRTARAVP